MAQVDSALILSPHELNLKFLTYFIDLLFNNWTIFLFCLFYQLTRFDFYFTYPLICFISNRFNCFLYFITVLNFHFLQLSFMIWDDCFCILNLYHKLFCYVFRILPQNIPDFGFPTGCILMHLLNILRQNSHLFPIHIRHLHSISQLLNFLPLLKQFLQLLILQIDTINIFLNHLHFDQIRLYITLTINSRHLITFIINTI